MINKDFTYNKYRELIKTLSRKDYHCFTVCGWIEELPEKGVILRHDVDRYPKNSLKIALIENELGIKSTYYFRAKTCSFDSKIINEISSMGHEIGYHYEDLAEAKGDYEKAINLFLNNLNKLREIAQIKTISMHGRPMSKFDNRDLWEKYNFLDYGLSGEAYLTINYQEIYYLSDTGRTWSDDGANVRDNVSTRLNTNLSDTDSLIRFFENENPLKTAILTHPERWNGSSFSWYKYYSRDFVSNNAKRIIKYLRK